MVRIMPHGILEREFFERPTVAVAKALLGKYLVRRLDGRVVAGRIVEVEAYVGPHDLACHASKGRTARTDVMFGPAGVAYVYLIYGMYHCLNVVTEREGYPAAVLIRGIEQGEVIDGPGRVCRLLQIDRTLNRLDLTLGKKLWIEDRGDRIPRTAIAASARIGVDYAGEWASKPYRFRLKRAHG
jgi:DNA-3-methyladenine glycosylase